MRKELKGLSEDQYWCYGVDESSLDDCLRLVKKFIEDQRAALELERIRVCEDNPEPDIQGEIISDIAHYAWCDAQVLWQLALWRCQGIFESMLKYTFLKAEPNRYFHGLMAKLDAMKQVGFELSTEEYSTLRE